MDKSTAEERALGYLKEGNHCAESIAKTILGQFAGDVDEHAFRIASVFGGGIGFTHEETCGALTGGVIALGYLAGRADPKGTMKDATILVQEFKDLFQERFGATSCPAIVEGFGPNRHFEGCMDLIIKTAGLLEKLITDSGIIENNAGKSIVAKKPGIRKDADNPRNTPLPCCRN